MANLITKSEYDRVKNEFYIVWIFDVKTSTYISHVTNVSLIKAVDIQIKANIKGQFCLIYPIKYHRRMPVVPEEASHIVDTFAFKVKVLPLLMEEREEPLTWEDVESYFNS